ncbi:hypothetical protein Peur_037753 [Populus x canadensis]
MGESWSSNQGKRERSISRSKEGRTCRLNRVPSRLVVSGIKSANMGLNRNRIVKRLGELSLIQFTEPEPFHQEDKQSDQCVQESYHAFSGFWPTQIRLFWLGGKSVGYLSSVMVFILLLNPSSSCHEDQPSRTKAPQPVLPVQPF